MTDEQKTNHAFARSLSNAGLGSAFQQAVHVYAQTDGTYAWPNSREGDMLREAKREIEILGAAIIAMAEDGWLYHGVEGMDDPQTQCYNAYLLVKPNVQIEGQPAAGLGSAKGEK